MSKELYFFCTKEILQNILINISNEILIKYCEVKVYSELKINGYDDLTMYNGFGKNFSGNQQSESFLVVEQDKNIILRKVEQENSEIMYHLDQEKNKDSIVFWPGGLYEKSYLICGHIGTISDSLISKKIYKIFQKHIKKMCTEKVGRYYISKNIFDLSNGYRLITMNVNEPVQYDLNINE